jgi:hypothetical protein
LVPDLSIATQGLGTGVVRVFTQLPQLCVDIDEISRVVVDDIKG